MPVPGAVARRTEREAQELREQGIDPNSGTPIAVQSSEPGAPAAVVTPSAAPASSDDREALQARIAELQAAESTQSGRASAAARELEDTKRQLEVINGNRSFLESKLTELTETVEQLKSENATIKQSQQASQIDRAVAELGEDPTEEMLKAFDSDAVALIQRVTNQKMRAVVAPLVERLKAIEASLGRLKELDKLPELERTSQVASIETARQKELEFLRKEVLAYYPDFDTVKDTAEWRDYLGRDIPGRGIKIGHLLQAHRRAFDAVGIRAVLAGFYDKGKKPGLDSLVVPAKTNADAPQAPTPAKIKASEYKDKLKAFTSKKLLKADWEAFRAKWDVAMASNNVEMDVELR